MKEASRQPPVILASASPRRRELMHLLGVEFLVRVAGIDEQDNGDESPVELVCRLSRDKGLAVAESAEHSIVIASDTIVVLDERVLGKPAGADEARAMLRALRGRDHHVISALTIIDQRENAAVTDWVDTRVHMREYTDAEIEEYIETGDPMDKAGAYAIQHPGFHPVSYIQGCYASVMGFPLCHLFRQLARTPGVEARHPVGPCMEFTGHHCTFHPAVLPPRAGA